jgi:hypothetical protein
MLSWKFLSTSLFFVGAFIGHLVFRQVSPAFIRNKAEISKSDRRIQVLSEDGLFDKSLSENMFHEVKILCWVFTHPSNHQNKSMLIKNLWGRRCNKLLFFSNEEDPVLGTVKLPVPNGRKYLWNKTILAYHYVSGFR